MGEGSAASIGMGAGVSPDVCGTLESVFLRHTNRAPSVRITDHKILFSSSTSSRHHHCFLDCLPREAAGAPRML